MLLPLTDVRFESNVEQGPPRWWHSSPGVRTCKRLVRLQARHDAPRTHARGQHAARSGGKSAARIKDEARKTWAEVWCADYMRGERMPRDGSHRNGRLVFDVGFHDGSDSIHVCRIEPLEPRR